jgi:hypothetical protein
MSDSSISIQMTLPSSPYRGIEPFRFLDKPIYVAREGEIRKLIRLITIYRGVLLYGDSGVGKSSLINAGLVPALLDGEFRPERLRVQPIAGKEFLLERIPLTDENEPPFVPSDFAQPVSGSEMEAARPVWSLQAFADRIEEFRRREADYARAKPASPLVLIFDQFEEIVTLVEETPNSREKYDEARAVRRQIMERLLALLSDKDLPVKLIFSFREDYLAKIVRLFALAPQLRDQTFRLTPLSEGALNNIIRRPFDNSAIPPGHFKRRLSEPTCVALESAFKELSDTGSINLTEVQIACLALWKDAALENRFLDENDHGKAVRRLFGDYLDHTLDHLGQKLRTPAIAALTHLVTSGGTRNIVSEDNILSNLKQENVSESDARDVLEALTGTTRLVFRQTRGDTAFYEITSEFLIPWIRQKRQAREAAELRRRLAAAAKQRTVAWIVACFCCVLTAICVLELWRNYQLAKKSTDLQSDINQKTGALDDLNAQVKNLGGKFSSLNSKVEERDARLNQLDVRVRQESDEVSRLSGEDARLSDQVVKLSSEKKILDGQLDQIKVNAEDILRTMASRLNETNEIGALSLQDVRARAQPFLNLDEVGILHSAFLAMYRLPRIISGIQSENDSGIGWGEILMAESKSILAVLGGKLDRAVAECNSVLERSHDFSKDLDRARAELLKVRGEIFATRGLIEKATENKPYVSAKGDWSHAVEDLQEAGRLVSNDPIFEAGVLLALSDIQRQLSFISVQQNREGERDKASNFAEEAKKQAEQALVDLSLKPETSTQVCFLLQDAYRKLGNVQLDAAFESDYARKTKESAERAELFYLASLEQSKLGERLWGSSSRQTARFLTAHVGKAFSQANLADIYELLLRNRLLTDSERVAYHKKCLTVLDDRITTCRELVKLQTSNRYFWTLLAQGYRNRGDYYLTYTDDKNNEEIKEKAFEDVRIAYLVAFPSIDKGLEDDYEKATGNRFGPSAKNQVAKLSDGALKEILPLVQKEQNESDPNPGTNTND